MRPTDHIDTMKQALTTLELTVPYYAGAQYEAITTLRLAIEQAEKVEPVAKVVLTEKVGLPCLQWLDPSRQFDFKGGEFLYTAPPQRQPLTEEEVLSLWDHVKGYTPGGAERFARAIEAAHGIGGQA